MSENVSVYLDRDNGSIDSIVFGSEKESSSDSQVEIISSEERREEEEEKSSEADYQTESGNSRETSEVGVREASSECGESDAVISHIDQTLNSFLGLFVITLVLVGCGLIIRFIWGLLNK